MTVFETVVDREPSQGFCLLQDGIGDETYLTVFETMIEDTVTSIVLQYGVDSLRCDRIVGRIRLLCSLAQRCWTNCRPRSKTLSSAIRNGNFIPPLTKYGGKPEPLNIITEDYYQSSKQSQVSAVCFQYRHTRDTARYGAAYLLMRVRIKRRGRKNGGIGSMGERRCDKCISRHEYFEGDNSVEQDSRP